MTLRKINIIFISVFSVIALYGGDQHQHVERDEEAHDGDVDDGYDGDERAQVVVVAPSRNILFVVAD